MACATIDRMQLFTSGQLCSVIWAASKLKKDVAQSGMFKSFLKVGRIPITRRSTVGGSITAYLA
jgi:hypothetical protein